MAPPVVTPPVVVSYVGKDRMQIVFARFADKDVTAQVAKICSNETTECTFLQNGPFAKWGDPFYGYAKRLTIEYRCAGEDFDRYFQYGVNFGDSSYAENAHGMLVSLNNTNGFVVKGEERILISKATFGGKDFTSEIKRICDSSLGSCMIVYLAITNIEFDPLPTWSKRLEIEYTCSGQAKKYRYGTDGLHPDNANNAYQVDHLIACD